MAKLIYHSMHQLSCLIVSPMRNAENKMESVRPSTMRGYMCYESNDSKYLYIAGWNYPNRPIAKTDLLGIFNKYNRVTWGKQTIWMVFARNNNDCLQIAASDLTATIESTKLSVLHIFLKDDINCYMLQANRRDYCCHR